MRSEVSHFTSGTGSCLMEPIASYSVMLVMGEEAVKPRVGSQP